MKKSPQESFWVCGCAIPTEYCKVPVVLHEVCCYGSTRPISLADNQHSNKMEYLDEDQSVGPLLGPLVSPADYLQRY